MKIAMLGIRGVPAQYSGLENCAEEVGARLAARGHEVIVYCRKGEHDASEIMYRGIRRITLPRLQYKVTDTYSHSLLALGHAVLKEKPDVILAFNPGIATLCLIPKMLGYKIALNADGFDWRRKKWGGFAKAFIYTSAITAARILDQLVLDADSARAYCAAHFPARRPPMYIPNGAAVAKSTQPEIIREYGLEPGGYFLFLSRIEPENTCTEIIRAFEKLDTDKKLVLGGGAGYQSSYLEGLKESKDPRILFPGPIYDPDHVRELHCGSYAVIHGNQAGGTSVGLVKALGFGTCVLTPHTDDNAYVVGDAGILYEPTEEALKEKLQHLLDHPEVVQAYREKATTRVGDEFNWDRIADTYENLFLELTKKG